jgi:WD40 repeat protein/energy-coupling factor transporter ATP-binding protein EcfA2
MGEKKLFLNPFPGIRSFEAEEDVIFFGRESQIKELIPRLYETRFLAITGSSGCGKSSLVRAGLLPSLFKGKHVQKNNEWNHQIFRPGNEPIYRLSEAIFSLAKTENITSAPFTSIKEIEALLNGNKSGLSELLILLQTERNKNFLLVIDQFEELFRFQQVTEKENLKSEADYFVQLLLDVASNHKCNCYIVITMRSDFLGDCTEFSGLPEAINKGHHLVVRMSKDEKELAITGPIEVCGGKISKRLVNQLLLDVGDDPDQLPVMQHALMRTWDYWILNRIGDEPIDLTHYEAIGTMAEAISQHAERIYQDFQNPRQKFLTEKLFKALTDLGSDNTGRGTRRPTPLKDICTLAEAKESEVISIIDIFRSPGCAFLMPSHHFQLNEESIIDISHESIMRKWERLKDWVEDETKSAQLYLRLSKSAELYQDGKAALWINPELQLALNWLDTNKPNATWAKRYDYAFDRAMEFLNYSKREFELEIAKKEKQQQRELTRARRFAIFLGAASVVSLIFLLVSLNLRFKAEASEKKALEKEKIAHTEGKKADMQKKEAISQKRIAEQQQQIAEQQQIITEEQKQYALEQQKIAEQQKQEALLQKQQADAAKVVAIKSKDEAERQKQDALNQKKIADTERFKAEVSEKNTMRLRLIAIARSMAIQAVKIQNNEDLSSLLSLQAYHFNKKNDGSVNDPDIYQALNYSVDKNMVFRGHQDGVRSLVLSGENNLISSGDDGTICIWDVNQPNNKPKLLVLPDVAKKGIRSLAISKDEKLLAAGTFEGAILLIDLTKQNSDLKLLQGHNFVINSVAFNSDNSLLASSSSDGTLRIWNLNNGQYQSRIIEQSKSRYTTVAFHPNKNELVIGRDDGKLSIINLMNNSSSTLIDAGRAIMAVTFSPDGKALISGDSKGTLLLWDFDSLTSKPIELIGHTSSINDIKFSNDNESIATASSDGTVRIWNGKKPDELPIILDGHDSWVYSVIFSDDGSRVFTSSEDKTVHCRIIKTNQLAEILQKKIKRNLNREEWHKYIGSDIPYEKTNVDLP